MRRLPPSTQIQEALRQDLLAGCEDVVTIVLGGGHYERTDDAVLDRWNGRDH
jgi:hypothetical protein